MSDCNPTWHFVFPYSLGASGSGLLIQNLAYGLIHKGYQVHLVSIESRPYITNHPACSWSGMILGKDFPLPRIPVYTGTAAPSVTFSELEESDYERYREALLLHWQSVLQPAQDDIVIVSHLWTHAAMLKQIGISVDGVMVHGTDLLAFKTAPRYHEEITIGAKWAKGIIANSSYVEQCLRDLPFVDPDIVVRIPPILDLDIFSYESYDYGAKRLVLHVPGKFVPFKGTDRLIRAVPYYEARDPDVHTIICGTGPLHKGLRMLLRRSRMDRLEWREGWLPRQRIAELLRIC